MPRQNCHFRKCSHCSHCSHDLHTHIYRAEKGVKNYTLSQKIFFACFVWEQWEQIRKALISLRLSVPTLWEQLPKVPEFMGTFLVRRS